MQLKDAIAIVVSHGGGPIRLSSVRERGTRQHNARGRSDDQRGHRIFSSLPHHAHSAAAAAVMVVAAETGATHDVGTADHDGDAVEQHARDFGSSIADFPQGPLSRDGGRRSRHCRGAVVPVLKEGNWGNSGIEGGRGGFILDGMRVAAAE
jgi:hypothetical protein